MLRKFLIGAVAAAAIVGATCRPASAQVAMGISFGRPRVAYYAPPPVAYVQPAPVVTGAYYYGPGPAYVAASPVAAYYAPPALAYYPAPAVAYPAPVVYHGWRRPRPVYTYYRW